ncbi:MAG: HlyC/CorC family transporter [Oscillospiraceae bacterium]|nr:HlyC/CorC family transporter [Oscillospiraceae bacterium]
MTIYICCAAIVLCLCGSAFFSASEMAYSSANRLRLENSAESGSKAAKRALYICDKYDDALSAILIGNNLVNIASSSLASVVAILLAGEGYAALATVLITVLVIIFGETMPKIVAKKNANRVAMMFSGVIRFLMIILTPVIFIVVLIVRFATMFMKGEEEDSAADELVSIIETVENEGVIDKEQSELLQNAVEFPEISASEVMTTRVDMAAIDIDDDWDDIVALISECEYSRIPVYEDSVDNVIGILHVNRFYKALVDNDRVDIRSMLLPPCFVYKAMKLPSVLSVLRKSKVHLAIVTDEYGGCMGCITIEDVLEQIVGEIWDESDEIENEIVQLSENEYELDGDLSINDFLDLVGRDEDDMEIESATVGGWATEALGHYPSEGEQFRSDNLTLTVTEVDGLRVEKVIVHVAPEEPEQ